MLETLFILSTLFIGSLLQGTSGFGFGLFSMGLLTIFLSVKDSMLIVLSLTVVLSTKILYKYWRFIRWKEISLILGASLVARIGAFFVVDKFGESASIKKWLGVVLIGMVIYLLMKRNHSPKPLSVWGQRWIAVTAGLVGGFIGGVFAIGGPFFVVYYLMRFEDKRHYTANLQATFITLNLFTLILHGAHGDFSNSLYFYWLAGLIVVLIGVSQGMKWFDRMPRHWIQKLASAIVFIVGFSLLSLY